MVCVPALIHAMNSAVPHRECGGPFLTFGMPPPVTLGQLGGLVNLITSVTLKSLHREVRQNEGEKQREPSMEASTA